MVVINRLLGVHEPARGRPFDDINRGLFREESARTHARPAIVLHVTGWQPGDGGQGNWNQPFGPDPGTNTYGTDPYANQPYGGNPYGGEPYPYGQPEYGQPEYGQTNQYPQYQTGGFPAQGFPPPPPPPQKRSKLPMVLSLVAIVIIVGAVVAIVLVNRNNQQTTSPPPSSEQQQSGSSEKKSSENNSSSSAKPDGEWIPVDNTKDAGLTYEVPGDWDTSDTPRPSGLGVDFTGNADYGVYECEDGSYVRTFAASGDVQGKDGADLDLPKTVEDFAKSFATSYYGEDAQIEIGKAEETEVDGKKALKLTAKVKPTVTKPACQATEGEVALIGVLLEGDTTGVAMLAVVNDLAGGPDDPKPVDASVTQKILDSVKAG